MSMFIWKESFCVHIEEIDEQHRQFFEYVNQLHSTIQTGEEMKVLNDIFQALSDYVQSHFKTEEEMLRILSYPGLEYQQKQHAYFESEIKALQAKSVEQSQIAMSTLEFLRDWFLNHIIDEDKKYGHYLDSIKTGTKKKQPSLGKSRR